MNIYKISQVIVKWSEVWSKLWGRISALDTNSKSRKSWLILLQCWMSDSKTWGIILTNHRDTLLNEALVVAKRQHQPLNDLQTQMPQDSESYWGNSRAKSCRTIQAMSLGLRIVMRMIFMLKFFDDADIDSRFTAEDRTLTDLIHEEIKYYMSKLVPLTPEQKKKRYYKMVGSVQIWIPLFIFII